MAMTSAAASFLVGGREHRGRDVAQYRSAPRRNETGDVPQAGSGDEAAWCTSYSAAA
jgi:hypothetical protein